MSSKTSKKGQTALAAKLLNVGFGNMVAVARVIAIVDPGSAPMKRLKDEAKRAGKLVDATNGRRTRSIIVTDSDHVLLSAIQTETIAQRVEADALSDRISKGLRAE